MATATKGPELQTGSSGNGAANEYLGVDGNFGDDELRRVIAEAEDITRSALPPLDTVQSVSRGLQTVFGTERIQQRYTKAKRYAPYTGHIAVHSPRLL